MYFIDVDINECATCVHNCHIYATCNNITVKGHLVVDVTLDIVAMALYALIIVVCSWKLNGILILETAIDLVSVLLLI